MRRHRKNGVIIGGALLALLIILSIPAAAFAQEVTQELDLEGRFIWQLQQDGCIMPGYDDTIGVGGTTKIQYVIDPSDLKVGNITNTGKGIITVTVPDVTGAVYITSLNIFMERLNGSVWERLEDSDGVVCSVPVVEAGSPVPVTASPVVLSVPANSFMDIPVISYDDDLRWASEMTIQRDGVPDEETYTGYQNITGLYGP
ncbi:MAG: hypothetical protein CVU89_13600 [Firmicutes bacterium HGW-Firmicutes-14]|nr:MAG: hypothetical protein CVU89_13600 [Firmicutes bacterium HGW-Firmicutes-14]